jgi:hypothetical protein
MQRCPRIMPKALAALAGQALKQRLEHLKAKAEVNESTPLPESGAPPPDFSDSHPNQGLDPKDLLKGL